MLTILTVLSERLALSKSSQAIARAAVQETLSMVSYNLLQVSLYTND